MRASGAQNGNWRGGRSIASNGYVLVRVGVGHHLADVRGYAYEHRVEAEKKIGRRLRVGEEVHHVNGCKTDNRHGNLEVCASSLDHRQHHRKPGSKVRRLPGEANPIILCACGCGLRLHRYDSERRERRYISGHNPMPAPVMIAVLQRLEIGPAHRSELGPNVRAVASCLSKLRARGQVEPVGGGVWRLRKGRRALAS